MIGGKDVVKLSGVLVPSTLTGRNRASPRTARPGGDGGNDLALLAEALTMKDDGDCKGASNG
jgi:hypothetical protein